MKIIKLLLLITISLGTLKSQTPSWAWAKTSNGGAVARAISSDQSGNVLIAGAFSNPIAFGTHSLTTIGGSDVFITKYDTQGNELWAISAGGTGNEYANSISTDAAGNVFVTGYFGSPTMTFGTFTLTSTSTSTNPSSIYVAKIDATGNVLWAKSENCIDKTSGQSIYSDALGNTYVTGEFKSNIVFGTTTLTSGPDGDIFIVKYNSAGAVVWATSFPTINTEWAYGISADLNGNVFVICHFSGASITIGTNTLINTGGAYDTFVSKLDPLGNVIWAKLLESQSTSYPSPNGISVDQSGNCFVTGYFYTGALSLGTTTLNNTTNSDKIFLIKYDPIGNVLWAKTETGSSLSRGTGLSLDVSGNCYITGLFGPNAASLGSINLISSGSADVFVAKYDASGNEVWAQTAGSTNIADFTKGIKVDLNGNIYTTGYFYGSTFNYGPSILTGTGTTNMFLAKLGNSTVGVNENEETKWQLDLYPNPSSAEITIESKNAKLNVRIMDVTGKLMFSSDLSTSDSKTIDVSSLKASLYIIEIENEAGQIIRKKLVKE